MIARLFILVTVILGAVFGQSLLTENVVRVLLVGLGFVAASVLPTVTLLVNGLTSTGRSVKSVIDLHDELRSTVNGLFRVLGLAVLTVVLLLPIKFGEFLPSLDAFGMTVQDPLGRLVSAAALATLAILTVALNRVPSAILRSLEIRKNIAIEEARLRNADRISKVDAAVAFPTKEGFGERTVFRVDA